MSERLSALDAAFLRVERDVQPVHVGFLLLLAGPPPTASQLRRLLVERLSRRLRQVPASALGDLTRPRWVDVAVDLDRHVRWHDLDGGQVDGGQVDGGQPASGDGELRLQDAVAALLEPALPRDRPLWDLHVLTGWDDAPKAGRTGAAGTPIPSGTQPRWAVLVRAHHAVVDGLAGVDALLDLLDPPGDAAAGARRPLPGAGRAALAGATRRRAAAGVLDLARAVGSPERVLSGSLSSRRSWRWVRGDLEVARSVAATLGASVNDVVLACVAGGLRALLLSQGAPVTGLTLRALVPVSLRTQGQRGDGGNLVSGVVARLPVGEPDPARRVTQLHAQLAGLKSGAAPLGPVAVLGLVERTPEPLAAALTRSAARWRHGWVATAVTNVPGPPDAGSLAGRELLEAFPCIPLGQRMRLTVGALSTGGALHAGVTADAVHLPGAEVVVAGIGDAWADLGETISR